MRRGTHETMIKAKMQADETRNRAEMRSLYRHNMVLLPTVICSIYLITEITEK